MKGRGGASHSYWDDGLMGVGWKDGREKRIQYAIGSNGMNGRKDRLLLSENSNIIIRRPILGRIYLYNKA